MNDRRRRRRDMPSPEPLQYAIAAEKGLRAAQSERARAFRSAAVAGWTLEEIGNAVGWSAATVLRVIQRYEISVVPIEESEEPPS